MSEEIHECSCNHCKQRVVDAVKETKDRACINCKFSQGSLSVSEMWLYCAHAKMDIDTRPGPLDGIRAGGYDGYGDYFKVGPLFHCKHFERA